MVILKEVGGVQIFGNSAEAWKKLSGRLIKGYRAEFNSEVCLPNINVKTNSFILPSHRGVHDYQIHLLENDTALVIKEGGLFLCTCINDKPCVLNFHPSFLP